MDNKIKVHWLVFVCLQLHTNQGSPGSDCLDFGPLVFFCCESSSSGSLWKMDAGLSNLAQNATFSPFVKASLFLPSAAHTVHISICQQVAILWSYNNKWSLQQTSQGTDTGVSSSFKEIVSKQIQSSQHNIKAKSIFVFLLWPQSEWKKQDTHVVFSIIHATLDSQLHLLAWSLWRDLEQSHVYNKEEMLYFCCLFWRSLWRPFDIIQHNIIWKIMEYNPAF